MSSTEEPGPDQKVFGGFKGDEKAVKDQSHHHRRHLLSKHSNALSRRHTCREALSKRAIRTRQDQALQL